MTMATQPLHVVVGVIQNPQGQILIAKRPAHVHQGDLWEFPGGKVEFDESPSQALRRELYEELAISIESFYPLGRVCHDYPDKSVLLDTYVVNGFTGEAQGQEGQPILWVEPFKLRQYSFPEANIQIIKMLELPEQCLITGKFTSADDFVAKLESSLQRGIRLVQLRLKEIGSHEQIELAKKAILLCQQYDAMLMLSPALFNSPGLDGAGMHLTSQQLFDYRQRPVGSDKLFSASVHDLTQLQQANMLQADFVFLSPVQPTTSHPGAVPLGWENFQQLAALSTCPVYALGGVDNSHLEQARRSGAHGIAAISALWGKQA